MSTFGGGVEVAAGINVAGGTPYAVGANEYAIVQAISNGGGTSTGTVTIDGDQVWSGTVGGPAPIPTIYVGPGQTVEITGSGVRLKGVLFTN